ncbi:MAG: guanylate kinase [Alphaproteobacteria bacterium]|nr:guanylate kinase [Alphaproteobacteria bacterium]|tara:strand:+ start:1443 stop:2081 length:639 start_codon:yes stop_codon:yes gene_type:complete
MMNSAIQRRGLMFVLSSPSGAGKTTLSRMLIERDSGIVMSVSATTRQSRPGETDGADYFFVDEGRFDQMVTNGEFLEHAKVFDHRYGTPASPVKAALSDGLDVLFDIDWQGAQQLKEAAREDVASVFILPPSMDELERRLLARAQDPEDVVLRRMSKAADEMSHWAEYDYIVVNESIDTSLEAVCKILAAERMKRTRQSGLAEFVINLQTES